MSPYNPNPVPALQTLTAARLRQRDAHAAGTFQSQTFKLRDWLCQRFVRLWATPFPCLGQKCRALRFPHSIPKLANLIKKKKSTYLHEECKHFLPALLPRPPAQTCNQNADAESCILLTGQLSAFCLRNSQRGSLKCISLVAPSAEIPLLSSSFQN